MPFTTLPGITVQTGSYSILASDDVVNFNISSASNATLPSAALLPSGKKITIKNINSSTASINVLTTSGQTVDGRASGSIFLSPNDFMQLVSDGINWKSIVSQESINAYYSTVSTQSLTNTTVTLINFDTKQFDSHSAVTTGASWKFTAPVTGTYEVSVMLAGEFSSWASASLVNMQLFKNNGGSTYIGYYRTPAPTGSDSPTPNGTVLVKLNAGDFIDVRLSQDTGVTHTLSGSAAANRIFISKKDN